MTRQQRRQAERMAAKGQVATPIATDSDKWFRALAENVAASLGLSVEEVFAKYEDRGFEADAHRAADRWPEHIAGLNAAAMRERSADRFRPVRPTVTVGSDWAGEAWSAS